MKRESAEFAMMTPLPPREAQPAGTTRAAGRPASRARRAYQRHGLYRLKATMRALGPRVLDRRTTLGKHLTAWRAALIRDLGGPDTVTTAQQAIVDLAMRTKLLLDSIDAWLLAQPRLVNARTRSLLPVVRERQILADALARYLGQLGLNRRATPVPDLATYLATLRTTAAQPRLPRRRAPRSTPATRQSTHPPQE